ncbi:MAG: carboxypeptidase regulatory-like domain-containing protein [Gemmatimonadaceae bacterium]
MNGRLTVLCALVLASTASGQTRSVSGVVRDSATGRPLAGAVVELRRDTVRRVSQSDDEGEFHLGEVPRATYQVSVRRLGYAARNTDVQVGGDDLTIEINLVPIARDLDTLYVRAGTGIYGIVGNSEKLTPLAGAKIQVLGENRNKLSDSSGAFFVPLAKGGTYLVRITRPGFAARMFPIVVASGRAVDASRLLDSANTAPGLEVLWEDFDKRLRWRGMNSALVTGSELRRAGAVEATPTFNTRGLRLGSSICVFINGTPRPGMNLDVVSPDRIEVMALSGASDVSARDLAAKWPARAACGEVFRERRYVATSGPRVNAVAKFAVLWLRPEAGLP